MCQWGYNIWIIVVNIEDITQWVLTHLDTCEEEFGLLLVLYSMHIETQEQFISLIILC